MCSIFSNTEQKESGRPPKLYMTGGVASLCMFLGGIPPSQQPQSGESGGAISKVGVIALL